MSDLAADGRVRMAPATADLLFNVCVGMAGIGAVISVIIGVASSDKRQFFFSYLFAYAFALTIALGALFWVLIHHLTGAGWSVVIRRQAENLARSIPVLAALMLPILVGMGSLYPWTDADGKLAALSAKYESQPPIAEEKETTEYEDWHLWHAKHGLLNTPFWLARLAVALAVWSALALTFARLSAKQDDTGEVQPTIFLGKLSAPGMLALALTATFASFDLLMSLRFQWYSTMFGVYFWAGGILGSMAALTLIVLGLRAAGYLEGIVTVEHLHDLGKLLFTFTIFWTYIAFCQYMLYWYANMPEETQFFRIRQNGSWQAANVALAVGQFVVPFVALLPRGVKRSPRLLAAVAAWILAAHLLDVYYQVLPNLHPNAARFHALDVTCLMITVGTVGAVVAWGMKRFALVPVRDPRLAEALRFHQAPEGL